MVHDEIESIARMSDEEVRLCLKQYGMEPLTQVPDELKALRSGRDQKSGLTADAKLLILSFQTLYGHTSGRSKRLELEDFVAALCQSRLLS